MKPVVLCARYTPWLLTIFICISSTFYTCIWVPIIEGVLCLRWFVPEVTPSNSEKRVLFVHAQCHLLHLTAELMEFSATRVTWRYAYTINLVVSFQPLITFIGSPLWRHSKVHPPFKLIRWNSLEPSAKCWANHISKLPHSFHFSFHSMDYKNGKILNSRNHPRWATSPDSRFLIVPPKVCELLLCECFSHHISSELQSNWDFVASELYLN